MDRDDAEILLEFKTESLEHLGTIEPTLLQLDAPDANHGELVNTAFRALHSVKGAAGFFDLDVIRDLAHRMESLLMPVRDGKRPYESRMTDVLLRALDKLQRMIEALPEIVTLPIEADVTALQALIDGSAEPAPVTCAIKLERHLLREHALDLKKQLLASLEAGTPVVVDASQVAEIDLPSLQVLAAFELEAARRSLALEWIGLAALELPLTRAGLSGVIGVAMAGVAS